MSQRELFIVGLGALALYAVWKKRNPALVLQPAKLEPKPVIALPYEPRSTPGAIIMVA